jgi:hypothetical protein
VRSVLTLIAFDNTVTPIRESPGCGGLFLASVFWHHAADLQGRLFVFRLADYASRFEQREPPSLDR